MKNRLLFVVFYALVIVLLFSLMPALSLSTVPQRGFLPPPPGSKSYDEVLIAQPRGPAWENGLAPEAATSGYTPLCMDDPASTLLAAGPQVMGRVGLGADRVGPGAELVRRAQVSFSSMPDVSSKRSRPTGRLTSLSLQSPEITGVAVSSVVMHQPTMRPLAVGPIPNVKVEGLSNNSGWVTAEADDQGNLYVAFERLYATGGSCPAEGCYGIIAGKSRDNGQSWDLWYVLASTAYSARRPSITVDGNGQLYIALELYYNPGTGYRWYPARAMSGCPRDVSNWSVTYYGTTYALVPGGTAADAGGDGDDVYMVFQVPYQGDGYSDLLLIWTIDGGSNWSGGYSSTTRSCHRQRPTVSVGGSNVIATYLRSSNSRRYFRRGAIGTLPSANEGNLTNAIYADADASGSYHYIVVQRSDDIQLRCSTDDGNHWSLVTVANTAATERYPAVSANGQKVRVAYIYSDNQTRLQGSDDNGQNWWGSPYTLNDAGNTTVAGFHHAGLAFHPIGGAADGKHPIAFWVDNRDVGEGDNIYLGTINDPPTAAALSWPSDSSTVAAFAPSLRWSGGSDPDGDTLRYTWYVDTSDGSTRVGGPATLLTSLPYYTSPGTTYYWKVVTYDGYQTSAASSVWSFTTISETFSGTPLSYTEDFATAPPNWTRKGFACLDCFEGDPIRWTVNPADKWTRSTDYAWSGSYSAHALYDADNADYQMTSPALDLRGTSWAYFNTHFRGSSELGYDYLYLESRPDGATSCWTTEDSSSGNYNAAWWSYYEGTIDLSSFAGTTTGQVRLRFETDVSNHGSAYGVGWYEDEIEVARESLWAHNAGGFYRLQGSEGSWTGYSNNLVDQLYSPFLMLPSDAGQSLQIVLTERYNIAAGDEATVWIHDTAAGTWERLASYSGSQGSFTDRTVAIPDSYRGKTAVIALVLRSDNAGTLSPQEQGGYWDVDRFLVEEFNPTAVNLAGFDAAVQGRDVLVTWNTASEIDLVGFNLYRSRHADGPYTRLNGGLIPAENPGSVLGASYEWLDRGVEQGRAYYYELEQVEAGGGTLESGLVRVVVPYRVFLPLILAP